MDDKPTPLPAHWEIGWGTWLFSLVAIVTAFGLFLALAIRLAAHSTVFPWYAWLTIPAGMALADFLSGMVHWLADTWGSETMPVLGKRLLHPFRVHHVNPADFLRRSFVDTNGEVAALSAPLLLAALFIPLDTAFNVNLAMFAASFLGIALWTNQIHQWAHMRRPPILIHALQQARLILRQEDHEQHHRPPYVQNYCITTGWCNRPLVAIGFFPRLERGITWLTGLQPRQDDQAFHDAVYQRDDTLCASQNAMSSR
jgi:hypothetical protein